MKYIIFIVFFLAVSISRAMPDGIKIAPTAFSEGGSCVVFFNIEFDNPDDFKNIEIKPSLDFDSNEVICERSWVRERSPKGRYIAIFIVKPKSMVFSIAASNFEGLPSDYKFNQVIQVSSDKKENHGG